MFYYHLEVRSHGQLNIMASEIHSGWLKTQNMAIRDYMREMKMARGIGTRFKRMLTCRETQGASAPEINDSGKGVMVAFRRVSENSSTDGKREEIMKAPGTMKSACST